MGRDGQATNGAGFGSHKRLVKSGDDVAVTQGEVDRGVVAGGLEFEHGGAFEGVVVDEDLGTGVNDGAVADAHVLKGELFVGVGGVKVCGESLAPVQDVLALLMLDENDAAVGEHVKGEELFGEMLVLVARTGAARAGDGLVDDVFGEDLMRVVDEVGTLSHPQEELLVGEVGAFGTVVARMRDEGRAQQVDERLEEMEDGAEEAGDEREHLGEIKRKRVWTELSGFVSTGVTTKTGGAMEWSNFLE